MTSWIRSGRGWRTDGTRYEVFDTAERAWRRAGIVKTDDKGRYYHSFHTEYLHMWGDTIGCTEEILWDLRDEQHISRIRHQVGNDPKTAKYHWTTAEKHLNEGRPREASNEWGRTFHLSQKQMAGLQTAKNQATFDQILGGKK